LEMGKSMLSSLRHSGLVMLVSLLACLLLFPGCSRGEQGTTEQQLLDNLISDYFSSWSKPDMEAYKRCFHPKASIYFIDSSGNPHFSGLEEFIAGQEKAHQSARERLFEKPTHISLNVQARLAQAEVRWELHRGSIAVTGTDYFTFVKTAAGWRILSLAFEQDKK
jgi:hypothetical protein